MARLKSVLGLPVVDGLFFVCVRWSNAWKLQNEDAVAETDSYRSIIVASQWVSWLASQLLKVFFAVEVRLPAGLFDRGPERCLIPAPTHQSVLDPWLIMSALRYRQWRMLIPVRILATQTFRGILWWLKPLIRILYRVEGVVELPPKEEGGTLPEKVEGLLDTLRQGDVGGLWKRRHPPVGEFAPGVVYLQRRSGARVLPIAVWMNGRRRIRARYIIEVGQPLCIPDSMDLGAGAAWLRDRTLELYERARRRGEEG